ncbi:MAG: hypothetical protein RLZZ403_1073, partial [Pseudomonadota bacterium]
FHVTLRYESLDVVLASSYLAATPGPRFRLIGTAGNYLRHGEDSQEHWLREGRRLDFGCEWGLNPEPGLLTRTDEGREVTIEIPTEPGRYVSFYPALADAIAGLGPPPVNTTDMVNVMRVLELAVVSAQRGREVTLA